MTLREQLNASISMEDAAAKLREARDVKELVDAWFQHVDGQFSGEARQLLLNVYEKMLLDFGVGGS